IEPWRLSTVRLTPRSRPTCPPTGTLSLRTHTGWPRVVRVTDSSRLCCRGPGQDATAKTQATEEAAPEAESSPVASPVSSGFSVVLSGSREHSFHLLNNWKASSPPHSWQIGGRHDIAHMLQHLIAANRIIRPPDRKRVPSTRRRQCFKTQMREQPCGPD